MGRKLTQLPRHGLVFSKRNEICEGKPQFSFICIVAWLVVLSVMAIDASIKQISMEESKKSEPKSGANPTNPGDEDSSGTS